MIDGVLETLDLTLFKRGMFEFASYVFFDVGWLEMDRFFDFFVFSLRHLAFPVFAFIPKSVILVFCTIAFTILYLRSSEEATAAKFTLFKRNFFVKSFYINPLR